MVARIRVMDAFMLFITNFFETSFSGNPENQISMVSFVKMFDCAGAAFFQVDRSAGISAARSVDKMDVITLVFLYIAGRDRGAGFVKAINDHTFMIQGFQVCGQFSFHGFRLPVRIIMRSLSNFRKSEFATKSGL
jgi:hypothetical protein